MIDKSSKPVNNGVDLVMGLNSITENDVMSSAFEIEDALLVMNTMNSQIDYYKQLKQYRVKTLDQKISSLSNTVDTLKKVILNTMKKFSPEKKTLNYPSIGKVTRRTVPHSWSIDDEQSLLEFLDEKGLKDRVVKIKEVIDKKKANEVLDSLKGDRVSVPGVSYGEETEGISISFDDNINTCSNPEKKQIVSNIEEMETLEV